MAGSRLVVVQMLHSGIMAIRLLLEFIQPPGGQDHERTMPQDVPFFSYQSVVCLSLLYGSYSYPTAEIGDHLA